MFGKEHKNVNRDIEVQLENWQKQMKQSGGAQLWADPVSTSSKQTMV